MRYRIQINPLLDCVLVTVTEIHEHKGFISHDTKMYTMDGASAYHGGLVEVLGWLQEQLA
jgi:hypothetical protein